MVVGSVGSSAFRNATLVNAIDGDGILYQQDVEAACDMSGVRGGFGLWEALGARILPGYDAGFSNHNMPYTTGEADTRSSCATAVSSIARPQGGLLLEPLRGMASHGGEEHIDGPNSGRRFRRAGRLSRTIRPHGLCSVAIVGRLGFRKRVLSSPRSC